MFRRITVAASIAALVALAACGRGDETAYDTAAGATAGAMATPPVITPGAGPTSTTTVGGTTVVIDSMGRTTSVTVGSTTEVKTGTKSTKTGAKTTKTPY